MEFPGFLGIGLYRLRQWLRSSTVAAIGPLLGIIAADIAIDISRGRFATVGVEVVIAPLIALTVSSVAQRSAPGLSGQMMFWLGAVSALGTSMLMALSIRHGSGPGFVIGLRHLTVWAYAWASIAMEPPVRRQLVFAPVGS